MDSDVPSVKIDATVPVSARIWNYWLGGKDYYPVDKGGSASSLTSALGCGLAPVRPTRAATSLA